MLEIEYKGGNAVIITTRNQTLAIDPNIEKLGLKFKEVKDAVELATDPSFLNTKKEGVRQFEGPGEYEVNDFSIRGVAARRHIDNEGFKATVYRIETGEFSLGIIGNIDAKLSEEQLESVGLVDLLILPVGGGGYTLDAKNAAEITRQIGPKIVIPTHYRDENTMYEVPQDKVEDFEAELGVEVEETPKYKLKNSSSLPTALTIVKIQRTS